MVELQAACAKDGGKLPMNVEVSSAPSTPPLLLQEERWYPRLKERNRCLSALFSSPFSRCSHHSYSYGSLSSFWRHQAPLSYDPASLPCFLHSTWQHPGNGIWYLNPFKGCHVRKCLLPWLQGSDFQRGQTAAQVSHAAHSSRGTASPCLVSSHKFAWLCGCIWLIWLCKLGYSPRYAAEKPALWIRAFVKMDPICTWFHQLHEMYRTFIWWNRQPPCSKREKPFCLLFHRRLLPYEEVKPSVMLLCS